MPASGLCAAAGSVAGARRHAAVDGSVVPPESSQLVRGGKQIVGRSTSSRSEFGIEPDGFTYPDP